MDGHTQHYFSTSPSTPRQPRSLEVALAGRDLVVTTDAGVFCPDRLDTGTSVLLRQVPPPPATGDLLDLGCGWGPMALTMALLSPGATVWAVDVNERALELTRDNALAVGAAGVVCARPDTVPDGLHFATMWSNPPIRIGKAALHEMLGRWLPRLEQGGRAHLVVQRNLGADSLQAWLAGSLGSAFEVDRVASSKGFRVLTVTRIDGTDQIEPA